MTKVVLGLYSKYNTNVQPAQHLAALHVQASVVVCTPQDTWLQVCFTLLFCSQQCLPSEGLDCRQDKRA